MNEYKTLFFCFLLALVVSCNNEAAKSPCLYGTPSPILDESIDGVSEYSFSASDSSGTETAIITDTLLSDGQVRFTLNQAGCNDIKQTFTFELPQNDYSTQADSFFVQRAAESLMVISQKSPLASQSFIPMFAYELHTFAAGVSLNRALAVDSQSAPGIFFMVSKIATKEEGIVILEFFSNKE